ncbi:hypothetical protein ABZ635_02685 [Nocardiopsis sp. NPDC007018]|uniref:hypothetical protein n=1 Tax=Nocardiopsis sp. NPDC007018 TaxID=3155721 RepID=UPI0033E0E161
MPFFIMILVAAAALAVLVGVVFVVLGKGGQLARFEADFPPLDLPEGRPVGSRDLAGLLVPLSMWGYHVRAVDELLVRLTATLREREERIEDLEWRLARLDPSYVPRGTGPRPGAYLPGQDELDGSPEGEVAEGVRLVPAPVAHRASDYAPDHAPEVGAADHRVATAETSPEYLSETTPEAGWESAAESVAGAAPEAGDTPVGGRGDDRP